MIYLKDGKKIIHTKMKVRAMVNVNQQGDPSKSREQEMTGEMIRELTGSSDFALTIGDNLMPLESGQSCQGLTSQTQQAPLADSKRHCQPVDLADMVAQGAGRSGGEIPAAKKVAPLADSNSTNTIASHNVS